MLRLRFRHIIHQIDHLLPTFCRAFHIMAPVCGAYADVDKKSADVGRGYHFNATVPVKSDIAKFWRRGYYAGEPVDVRLEFAVHATTTT